MTSDFYVRGFCGPSIIRENSIAVLQSYKDDDDVIVDRTCCLVCSQNSGVITTS
jgi:hypothetical protein